MLAMVWPLALWAGPWRDCGGTNARLGVEAGEWVALNAAEADFLGDAPGRAGVGGSLTDVHLRQGTRIDLFRVQELTAGRCTDAARVLLRFSPLVVDLPEGIGVFTDPARIVGVSLGVKAERFWWQPLGAWQAGLGLGVEADWHKMRVRSALVTLDSETVSLNLPITLMLRRPLPTGAVEIWLRQSWSTEGTRGQAIGLAYSVGF